MIAQSKTIFLSAERISSVEDRRAFVPELFCRFTFLCLCCLRDGPELGHCICRVTSGHLHVWPGPLPVLVMFGRVGFPAPNEPAGEDLRLSGALNL